MRSDISLHVSGREQRIRVPRVAWEDLLVDLPKYEIVYVEVEDDQPPSYDSSRKGKGAVEEKVVRGDEKHGLGGWMKGLFRHGHARDQHV